MPVRRVRGCQPRNCLDVYVPRYRWLTEQGPRPVVIYVTGGCRPAPSLPVLPLKSPPPPLPHLAPDQPIPIRSVVSSGTGPFLPATPPQCEAPCSKGPSKAA